MAASKSLDPWEGIEFEEEIFQEDSNQKIPIFTIIKFDSMKLINFHYTSLFNEITGKIQLNLFTNNDYINLNNFFESFTRINRILFQKVASKLKDQDDPTFYKILKTIDVAFSPIGLAMYKKGEWYFFTTEMIYNYYLKCLLDIEELTGFRVHKGVPSQMLGLIYGNSDRNIRMLCQLGMTLKEDRLSNLVQTPATNLLNHLRNNELILYKEIFNDVKIIYSKQYLNTNKFPNSVQELIQNLRDKMETFPKDAFLFMAQKYEFTDRYLIEFYQYDDIYSSILRLELLIYFTAFIETLLRRTLCSDKTLMPLINEFNQKALKFNCIELNNVQNYINSYNHFYNNNNTDDPNYYSEFCDYVLNLTENEPTNKNKIDISSKEKLKIFQSSLILWQTRNRFHHDLIISTTSDQVDLATKIPNLISYIVNTKKYNKIFKLLVFYSCIILIHAYDKFC